MKKIFFGIILLVGITSCKTRSFVVEGAASGTTSAKEIIKKHYSVKKEFNTLYIKASARYRDPGQVQSVSAEIRMKRDEKILISVRFLGITMAKALITPEGVSYYEKPGGTFFEGGYETLSQWLGTDLDFQKVQNMLVGQAMDNLKEGNYLPSIEKGLYKLEEQAANGTQKAFLFESKNFLIKKQQIAQPYQNRQLGVEYPAYKDHKNAVLPASIVMEVLEGDNSMNVSIEYNSVVFDEEFTFPYKVPGGYQQVGIE